jgi:hypothetical protein
MRRFVRAGKKRTPSLDHLVSAAEERVRYREAERLGGPKVDDQLEFGWLLDRQIGRLDALQDLVYIGSGTPELLSVDRPI